MVKDYPDGEKGIPLPPLHGLLISINRKVFFYMHHPTHRIVYSTAFVVTVVKAGMRNGSMGPPWGIGATTHRTMNIRSTTEMHLIPFTYNCR